ncbi:MAG: NAD(P)-binding domain-containing protein [Candidatus Binataceae bacterium]
MRRLGWIIGTAAILLLALMLAPRRSYQPGPLMAGHRQLVGQCVACHKAWRGPVSDRCVACHGDITDVNPHGSMDMSDELAAPPGAGLALDADNYLTCLSCHSEHQGRVVNIAATAAFACTWCHKHPSINAVPEHLTPVMSRPASPRNTFSQPFNHAQHKALIEGHSPPRPNGFDCMSCHIVKPVTPPQSDAMSFRWQSCAGSGCHIVPQDTYLKLPQSIGTDPVTLAYTARVFHLNAVFVHSSGHLASVCATCHLKIAISTAPDDDASLTVAQCFICHAHQPQAASGMTALTERPDAIAVRGSVQRASFAEADADTQPRLIAWLAEGAAIAANASQAPLNSASAEVVACGQCHPFHHHGVVLANDFHTPAPKFPPNRPMHLYVTLYLPTVNPAGGLSLEAARVSPWWLGVLGVLVSSLGFLMLPMLVPSKVAAGEIVMEVAPQPTPEVPLLDDTYQTSVRHLYIVGEAAGTASINLAMRAGRQVIEAIAAELKRTRPIIQPDLYDVAIVGCGPAGLGATATAQVLGLKYLTLEKMTPASTLRAYPRAKFIQATPIDIAEYGSFFLEGDNSREELIKEWERIIAHLNLTINDREEVVEIVREPELFRLRSARQHIFSARFVVLAIGVRGNPRHLNMPGDEPGRVHYMLIDAEEYHDRDILVVGGGNAGAEVAQALADMRLGNRVSYSFRANVLANVSRENAEKISELQRSQAIKVYPGTALTAIRPGKVVLAPAEQRPDAAARGGIIKQPIELTNELIFALIGAELPTAFLKQIGIRMGSKGRFTVISS